MKIEDIAEVTVGVILSRVKAKPGEEHVKVPILTIQDLNRETGDYSIEEEITVEEINPNKYNSELLSHKGMVLIGITSYKAFVIDENYIGRVIPSYFAIVDLDKEKVDPYYFTWYFNEEESVKKQLTIAKQGSSIKSLSVQMLRELEVVIPPIEIQRKIGKIYYLRKLKEKKLYEKGILERNLINSLLKRKVR